MPFKVISREPPGDEQALRERSSRIVDALVELGVTHAVGIPDNMSRLIFELCDARPAVQLVPVCREGEAWGIASGLWVGGQCPVVIIQNTGFYESGDALRGTAIEMGVPLLTLLGYRGYRSLSTQNVDSAARFFEPMLRAWGMLYWILEKQREAEVLHDAFTQARVSRRPVAVLMA